MKKFWITTIIITLLVIMAPGAWAINSGQHPGQFPYPAEYLERWVQRGIWGNFQGQMCIFAQGVWSGMTIYDGFAPNPAWMYINTPQLSKLVNTDKVIQGEQKGYLRMGVGYYDSQSGNYMWWESWIPASALSFKATNNSFYFSVALDEKDIETILRQSDFYGNWLPWETQGDIHRLLIGFFGPSQRGTLRLIYKDQLPN